MPSPQRARVQFVLQSIPGALLLFAPRSHVSPGSTMPLPQTAGVIVRTGRENEADDDEKENGGSMSTGILLTGAAGRSAGEGTAEDANAIAGEEETEEGVAAAKDGGDDRKGITATEETATACCTTAALLLAMH